jgi:transcriptional regulator with XRE-family HTH domain
MAKANTKFDEFVADKRRRRIFEREALAFEASELICRLMEERKINKAELAKRMGASKSHVTQLLSGSRNMTMHTLAGLSFALGHKIEIKALPLEGASERLAERRGIQTHPTRLTRAHEHSAAPKAGARKGK